MRNLFLYVSAAVFTFAGTCAYVSKPAPQALKLGADAYSLVIEQDGQAYVADYNLTLSDCAASMRSLQHIKPQTWPACERQPQGPIGEGA